MIKPRRDLWLLFVVSLIVRLLAIFPVHQPGYMDAAYSFDIALNLARGQGLTEPFLWNYLDDPVGLPHPSHLYWMPLPTLLAWLGLVMFGQSYRAAQVPFALVSALLPLVSYWVAVQITGYRRHGWLAGLLTLFSGFYVLYWGHTDNFTPFALGGSLGLIAAWRANQARRGERGAAGWSLAAGVLAGLAHLSRADGPLLLIGIIITIITHQIFSVRHSSFVVRRLAFVIFGYLLVMLPWFARNWMVVGAPLPATGAQTMWLTTYDDLYSYGRELSLQTYLAWGWGNILCSKLDALWVNTQTVLAVFCMVFLAPLVPVGWWRLRRHPLFQLVAWYFVLLFLAMTVVFTFPGPRGGLLHSGSALLPFIFTAALVGLDALVEWAAARRPAWNPRLAKQVFGVGLVGLASLVSGFLYYRGVIVDRRWRGGDTAYGRLVEWLDSQGEGEAVVMLGDPAGYWYHGGGPSIVVPNESVEAVLVVADRYKARYLILDHNRPAPLASLYEGEEAHPRLRPIETLPGEMHVYHIALP